MRKIKFRAWHRIYSVMVTGKDLRFDGVSWSALFDRGMMDIVVDKDPIIMQFTGLQDKNGVDIYEGDVIHCGDMDEQPLTVKWIDDRHCWGFDEETETFHDYYMEGWEVIGNIHEVKS